MLSYQVKLVLQKLWILPNFKIALALEIPKVKTKLRSEFPVQIKMVEYSNVVIDWYMRLDKVTSDNKWPTFVEDKGGTRGTKVVKQVSMVLKQPLLKETWRKRHRQNGYKSIICH